MRASTISVRNSARPALRVSTVLEGLSHALDLTEGHPRGHATRTALIGLRLGRALHLAPGLQAELLYALLLKDAGCSANASLVCDLFGGCDHEVKRAVWLRDWRRVPEQIAHAMAYIGRGSSLVARMRQFGKFAVRGAQGSGTEIFAVRCERGARIARMVGLSDAVVEAIRAMDEHWDGGGYPYKLRGDRRRCWRASSGWRRSSRSSGRKAGPTGPSTWPASGAAAGSIPSWSTPSSPPPATATSGPACPTPASIATCWRWSRPASRSRPTTRCSIASPTPSP